MYLIFICISTWILNLTIGEIILLNNNNTKSNYYCPTFPEVENGTVIVRTNELPDFPVTAHITCNTGFDLSGPPKVLCIDGNWEDTMHPQCIARCKSPPFIKNGEIQIEGVHDGNNMYRKGVTATYICSDGFELTPPESNVRLCEKGIWTGEMGYCAPIVNTCKKPESILYGYLAIGIRTDNIYKPGHRIEYACNPGYSIKEHNILTCQGDGNWIPKIMPRCIPVLGKL